MTAELNACRQEASGKEFWHASALFKFLRLHDYPSFEEIIGSAADICNRKGNGPDRHFLSCPPIQFRDEGMDIILDEYKLSAYGAFLVAKHLDESLPAVQFMLNYFPAEKREWLALALRRDDWERLKVRQALRQVEKDFAHALRNLHLGEEGYGLLKSSGDKVLFGGFSTKQMRTKLGLDADVVLSDYLPAVTMRARISADTHTIEQLELNPRRTEDEVADLHRHANQMARNALLDSWIKPEFLPVAENIHHLEHRFKEDLDRVIESGLPL
jgi:DNA-damage-inducible protein D